MKQPSHPCIYRVLKTSWSARLKVETLTTWHKWLIWMEEMQWWHFLKPRPVPSTGITRASDGLLNPPTITGGYDTRSSCLLRAATLMPLLHEAISKCSTARGEARGIKPCLLGGSRECSRRMRNGESHFFQVLNVLPPKHYCLLQWNLPFSSARYLFLQETTFPEPPLLHTPRPQKGVWGPCTLLTFCGWISW